MEKDKTDTAEFFPFLDFVLEIYKEKIPGKGEDSYMCSVRDDMGMVAVFDGLGGAGATTYKKYRNKTGAYMASRVVSGVCKKWFSEVENDVDLLSTDTLKERIKEQINFCDQYADQPCTLSGSMIKNFPTTMASAVCNGQTLTCFWCGDSRCYVLDSGGLRQLTKDDARGNLDAMQDVGGNSPMSNVISASKDFPIHCKQITLPSPCIVFAATDGCYAYLPTPMNFELMLIETLQSSKSVADWEAKITEYLQNKAGDDFTLTGFSMGFDTFDNLRDSFSERRKYLSEILNDIEKRSEEEKYEIWKTFYKSEYEKYMKEG